MSPASRPGRIGDQLRVELADLIAREVHDPGIGFLTITHVKVTPDLQIARVYYTTLGDETARKSSERALGRAAPFLRRRLGGRLRLKRVPQLEFFFDESIERGDRIERILNEISAERAASAHAPAGSGRGADGGGARQADTGAIDTSSERAGSDDDE